MWIDRFKPAQATTTGWRLFQLGLFFMPTSALLSGLSLLAALTICRSRWSTPLGSRPLTRWFALLAVLLILGTLLIPNSLDMKLRIFNWVPFMWLLCSATPYLSSRGSRQQFGQTLIVGTIPVVVAGCLQIAFNLSGPWTALGGLINWDMPARFAGNGAGVFPNPNFTAAWYALVLPMLATYASTLAGRLSIISLVAALVFTASRTALTGAIGGILLLSWRRYWKAALSIVITIAILVLIALRAPEASLQRTVAARLTGGLADKVTPMMQGAGTTAADAIASGREPFRSELFAQAFDFIRHYPLLGKGQIAFASTSADSPKLITHTHNIFFQFAIDFGLPIAILFATLIGWIVVTAWTKQDQLSANDRAIVVSTTIAIWLHAFDIPSFDSRINMLGWLLLSGCWAFSSETASRQNGPTAVIDQDPD